MEVSRDNKNITGIETISRKRLPVERTLLSNKKDVYTIKRLYSERDNRVGCGKMTRIISKVYSCEGIENFAVIQYFGNASITNQAHGNSKDKRTSIRTKPSVTDKERELLKHEPPKKVVRLIDEQDGPISMLSSSDGSLDRRQCYN